MLQDIPVYHYACHFLLQSMNFCIMVGTGCPSDLKRAVSALFNLAFQREQEHVNTVGEGKKLCKMDGHVVCMQCEM